MGIASGDQKAVFNRLIGDRVPEERVDKHL